jgi:hypothetical protein
METARLSRRRDRAGFSPASLLIFCPKAEKLTEFLFYSFFIAAIRRFSLFP